MKSIAFLQRSREIRASVGQSYNLDIMDTTQPCAACGAEAVRSIFGELMSVSCEACGHVEQAMLLFHMPPIEPRRVRLAIRWSEPAPTSDELHAVRKLIPAFADEPLPQLKKELSASPTLDLAITTPAEGELVEAAAKRVGLKVEQSSAADHSAVQHFHHLHLA